MIVPLRRGTIRYAVVAELADAHGSGPCGRPWGFESLRPHQNNKTSILDVFLFSYENRRDSNPRGHERNSNVL